MHRSQKRNRAEAMATLMLLAILTVQALIPLSHNLSSLGADPVGAVPGQTGGGGWRPRGGGRDGARTETDPVAKG